MKKLLAVLLAVSILLCCASSAFAVEEEIDYEELFYKTVYTDATTQTVINTFIFDTRSFIRELAFQYRSIQQKIIDVLSRCTKEQLSVMHYLAEDISLQFSDNLTNSENSLIQAMLYQFTLSEWFFYRSHRDYATLFREIEASDGLCSEALVYELTCAITNPADFARALAQEDLLTQSHITSQFAVHNHTTLGTIIVDSINNTKQAAEDALPHYLSYLNPSEIALLDAILEELKDCAEPTLPTQPDPNEKEAWLSQERPFQKEYPKTLENINHYQLFSQAEQGYSSTKLKTLIDAFIYDTTTSINNLAFRNATTQEAVINTLASGFVTPEQLNVICYLLKDISSSESALTTSETNLLDAMLYALEFEIISRSNPPHYDYAELFRSSEQIEEWDLPNFLDTLAQALNKGCIPFVFALAKEDTQVQERVVSLLAQHNQTIQGAVLINCLTNAKGTFELPDDQKELAIIDSLLAALNDVPVAPTLTDPDPDEFEQWLAQKKQEQETRPDEPVVTIDPTYIFTYPVETHPQTNASSDTQMASTDASSTEGSQESPDWLMILCFCIAAAAIAFGFLQQRKTKKKAAPSVAVAETVAAYPAALDEDKKAQITAALKKHYGEFYIDWYCKDNPQGTARFYGSENGYDILFYAGGFRLGIPGSTTIAGKTFYHDTEFELLVHQDGNITRAQQAFEDGLISRDAIVAAYKLHEQCESLL